MAAQPEKRKFLPPFAELMDQLTIHQIKEVLFHDNHESYAKGIKKICHDIDLLIEEKNLKLSSKLIRRIIIIAQMNLHIWHNKDKMQEHLNDNETYLKLLKIAHQLNGIRNQMKNALLEECGDKELSGKKTNFETDGLKGWKVSA